MISYEGIGGFKPERNIWGMTEEIKSLKDNQMEGGKGQVSSPIK